MCQFYFEGFKAMSTSSLTHIFNSQEKVFHPGVFQALTRFTHTFPQFRPFIDSEHKSEVAAKTETPQCPFQDCLLGGASLFLR